MILGIGCDVVSISRLQRDILRNPEDFDNVFTPNETAYAESKGEGRFATYAGRFAVKEAFIKSLSMVGELHQYRPLLKHIEVDVGFGGRAEIKIVEAKLKDFLKNAISSNYKVWVSISHEADMAMGMVVLEGF